MRLIFVALAVASTLAPTSALAADRARAAVTCKPAPEKLAYDCTFRLSNARTGAPLDQAEVSIGADMPSMPLAHNVRPVTATATGAPGEYQARLTLEMHGDWALRLKVAGPVKDQIVEVLRFTATAAGPPPRKPAPARGEHKH
jgi:YtkA-like protein